MPMYANAATINAKKIAFVALEFISDLMVTCTNRKIYSTCGNYFGNINIHTLAYFEKSNSLYEVHQK